MNTMYLSAYENDVIAQFNMEMELRKRFPSEEIYRLELAKTQARLGATDDEEDYNPVSYTVAGSVAILGINGSTRASASWITRLCGIPTYDDIRIRFQQAYADNAVKAVVMNINSTGGEAAGTNSLSLFISNFNNKAKPVIGYTAANCMSAAMWYGTAGSALAADSDAQVGSIGALCVFMTYTRMLKENGIDVTVFRSAPYKAVPSAVEKLDDKGREVLNENVKMWHERFVTGLSNNIDKTPEQINKTIANGKVFMAEQALNLGLVKPIITFDKLIANLNAKFDNSVRPPARA